MNPFTKFLSQWSRNEPFAAFVSRWDLLELLIIEIYREKRLPADAQPAFDETWRWLRAHYPRWEGELRPFWQQTKAAGQPTQVDPFQLLLDIRTPQDILGDWRAMQHLPAAREAINQFLVSSEK